MFSERENIPALVEVLGCAPGSCCEAFFEFELRKLRGAQPRVQITVPKTVDCCPNQTRPDPQSRNRIDFSNSVLIRDVKSHDVSVPESRRETLPT
jgi:hypothetical protein